LALYYSPQTIVYGEHGNCRRYAINKKKQGRSLEFFANAKNRDDCLIKNVIAPKALVFWSSDLQYFFK